MQRASPIREGVRRDERRSRADIRPVTRPPAVSTLTNSAARRKIRAGAVSGES